MTVTLTTQNQRNAVSIVEIRIYARTGARTDNPAME